MFLLCYIMDIIFITINLILGIIASLFAAHIASLTKGGIIAKPMRIFALAILFFTVGAICPLIKITAIEEILDLIRSASLMISLLLFFLASYKFKESLNRETK